MDMDDSKRIYLASPYSHSQASVREERYRMISAITARLMTDGYCVFSPIVHSHPLAKTFEMPTNFKFWQDWCMSFLRGWANSLCVVKMAGWDESTGVKAEIAEAKMKGVPIKYIDPEIFFS